MPKLSVLPLTVTGILIPAGPALALQPPTAMPLQPTWGAELAALALFFLAAGFLLHARRLRRRLLANNAELTLELARRAKIEMELRERDASVRTIVESANTIIFTLDAAGVFRFVEGRRLASMGLTPERLTGRHLREVFSHRPDLWTLFERCAAGERLDEPVVTIGGEFQLLACPVPGPDGGVERVVGIVRDVSEAEAVRRQLAESEARFRSIFENAPFAITINRASDGAFLDANSACLKRLRLTREQLLGGDPAQMVRYADYEPADLFREELECGGLRERELRVLRPGGDIGHLLCSSTPISLGGQPCLLSMTVDLTERKRAELALRESQALLSALKESIPDLVWLKDPLGRYITCNPAFERVYGVREAELAGRTDYDLEALPEAADLCLESDRRALTESGPLRFEECLRVAETGQERLFETLKTPMRDSEGKLIGVLGIARDMTDRKNVEQALRESQALLSALKENFPDLVWLKDPLGRYITCNPAFERVHGVREAELAGRTGETLTGDSEEDASFLSSDRQVLTENRMLRFEERLRVAETGQERLFETLKTPMRDSEGKLIGVLGIARDITDRRRREAEVRSWMRRFDIVNATAKHLFYDYERESDWVTWSGPLTDVLGLEDGELDGSPEIWKSRLHPKDAPAVLNILATARKRCGEFETDYRLQHKNGRYIHMHACGLFLPGEDGEAARILGVLQNISARKDAEDALALSERRLQMLLSAAHDSVLMLEDGRIVDCNISAAKMFQLNREELIGRTPLDFSPALQPDGEPSREVGRRVLQGARTGNMLRFEWMHVRADGELFPVEISLNAVEVNGALTTLSVMRDVTERKNAERLLRQSEEKFSKVFAMAPYGIAIVRLSDAVVVDTNRAFETLTGHPREQILGRPTSDLGLWDDPARHEAFLARILREGVVVDFDFQLRRANGALRSAVASAQCIHLAGEACFINLVRDVTEVKMAQQSMVQTEKMLSLGGLAAGMAHEINNPLGIIFQSAMGVQRRLDPAMPANQREAEALGLNLTDVAEYLRRRNILRYLEGIREAGERAAGIVRNMLRFSRSSDSGMMNQDLEELVLHAVSLAESDYDLKKRYDFKQIRLTCDFEPGLPNVPCLPLEIEQVLLNLLRNAAQAMAEAQTPEPAISVRAYAREDQAVLEIADNGPGIPQARQSRVFEPFYTTKKVGEGTGLGLSVSYFIVTTTHRGSLDVSSEPGQGTRFILRLPLTRRASAA